MAVPSSSDAFVLSGSSSFLGPRSMLSFEDVNGLNGSKRSFFQSFDYDEIADEDLDEYLHQPEKKRRLTVDQVRFLERSFDEENKLEPERKVQLAKDLGLQPRQVAIWFQNRRARWKTKQLEKDFEVLQSSFNSLSAEYETLLKEKDKLKVEVDALKEKLEMKEKKMGSSELSPKLSSQGPLQNPTIDSASEGEVSKVLILSSKQEEICSAKSDIFDSESPYYTDASYSSLMDPGDSSYAFEPDQSDLSQDEDDSLSKNNSLVGANIFPKLEGSSNFGFSGLDNAFWSWSY